VQGLSVPKLLLDLNIENILGVTFTNKAAKEMKTRVMDIVGPSASQVWMYTFHAFGLQILRRHIHLLPYGYLPSFHIIDEDDVKVIIKDVIKSLNLEPKDYSLKHLRNIISLYIHNTSFHSSLKTRHSF